MKRTFVAAMMLVGTLMPLAAQPTFALYAYIHVNTSADNTNVDGLCSLREAIIATDNRPWSGDCTSGNTGVDRILFDVATANVSSQLPTITKPVVIYSNLGGPRAEIHGPGSGTALLFGASAADGTSVTGLFIDNFAVGIDNGGNDMTIAGNVIGPNSNKAINVSGGTVTIGGVNGGGAGSCSTDCNRISGNGGDGISVHGGTVTIKGNLIGLDSAATGAQANDGGIYINGALIDGVTVTIGGSAAGERNVISGNSGTGLYAVACNCTIQGNYIGTDVNGAAAIPNGVGLVVRGLDHPASGGGGGGGGGGGDDTTGVTVMVGGTDAGQGNVVSGNADDGIEADGFGVYDHLTIYGNHIGVKATSGSLPNVTDGIALGKGGEVLGVEMGSPSMAGAANVIAYNGDVGVWIGGSNASGDSVRGNSIHDNANKGIALFSGANGGIAAPVVLGTSPVHGTACGVCVVDIYSDSADEGRIYEGSVTSDASGNWTYANAVTGPNVRATATVGGNTSEFSVSPPTAYQPDGRIRKGSGSFIGNNIYNTTGLNQTKSGSKTPGNTQKFGISVQNDAAASDKFKVAATGTTVTGYKITYFHGTTNITAAVVAGTFMTPMLTTGATYLITAKVKVTSTAAHGSSVTRMVTITSVGDGTEQDAVKFILSRT